jgi:hypothetical protein
MAVSKISKAIIRMYRMGTGDCFALKFLNEKGEVSFKMMIDAGVCSFAKKELLPYMEDLLDFVDDEVDALVVTHEHYDHIMAFDKCKDLFQTRFKPKEIWLGWTEDDSKQKVENWKRDYGEKKFALYKATEKINKLFSGLNKSELYTEHPYAERILGVLEQQREVVNEFTNLAIGEGTPTEIFAAKKYIGDQAGMKVVKDGFGRADTDFRYHYPGDLIDDFEDLGIRFYVLGPPKLYEQVELEAGDKGESYEHSQNDKDFNMALIDAVVEASENTSPFDSQFHMKTSYDKAYTPFRKKYEDKKWRKIDHDWIMSSAGMSLRMNSLTNNLSLALAIEIIHTGEILLFPGDAEYGSWSSWQDLTWDNSSQSNIKAEDLLNKTILYKVAHHMSHNGTAQRLGLNMMTNKKLTALVPLSYDKIFPAWRNTMPNRFIFQELLEKTKGRIIMNSMAGMRHKQKPLRDAVYEYRKKMNKSERNTFDDNTTRKEYCHEYMIEF